MLIIRELKECRPWSADHEHPPGIISG